MIWSYVKQTTKQWNRVKSIYWEKISGNQRSWWNITLSVSGLRTTDRLVSWTRLLSATPQPSRRFPIGGKGFQSRFLRKSSHLWRTRLLLRPFAVFQLIRSTTDGGIQHSKVFLIQIVFRAGFYPMKNIGFHVNVFNHNQLRSFF